MFQQVLSRSLPNSEFEYSSTFSGLASPTKYSFYFEKWILVPKQRKKCKKLFNLKKFDNSLKLLKVHAIIHILKPYNYLGTTFWFLEFLKFGSCFLKWCLQHLWSYICSICEERCLQGKKNEDFIKFIQKYSLVLCMGVEMGKKKL